MRLTPREWQVLERLAQGMTNERAAESLDISVHTLRVYRARILEKTGCLNSFQLGMWTQRNFQPMREAA